MVVGIILVLFVAVTVWFWLRVWLTWSASKAFRAANPRRALRLLTWAIRLHPKGDSQGYYNRGAVHLHLENHDAATADFKKSLFHNPRNALTLMVRATFHQQANRDEEALADFNAALAIAPNDIDIRVRRAWHLVTLDDLERATEDCERALEQVDKLLKRRDKRRFRARYWFPGMDAVIDSQCAIVFDLQAGLLSRQGQYEEALTSYARALEFQPENAGLYVDRATAHLAADQFDAALEDLDRAETLITEDPSRNVLTMSNHRISEYITMHRAIAYHAQERIEEAVTLWRDLMDIDNGYGREEWVADTFIWQDELLEEAYTIVVRAGAK